MSARIEVKTGIRFESAKAPATDTVVLIVDGIRFETDAPNAERARELVLQVADALGLAS